jgi:uncharacterized membrane protein
MCFRETLTFLYSYPLSVLFLQALFPPYLNCHCVVSQSVKVKSLAIWSTVNISATIKYWFMNWRNLVCLVMNKGNLMFRRPEYAASLFDITTFRLLPISEIISDTTFLFGNWVYFLRLYHRIQTCEICGFVVSD